MISILRAKTIKLTFSMFYELLGARDFYEMIVDEAEDRTTIVL